MEGDGNIVTFAIVRIEFEEGDSIDTGAATINFSCDVMDKDFYIRGRGCMSYIQGGESRQHHK